MAPVLSKKSISVAAICLACGIVLAQGKNDMVDGGSLASLTAEVRQLRLAVEDATRSQTQTQASRVYLSVQQSRVLHVATRLDSVRKELDGIVAGSRNIASQLANSQDALLKVAEPQQRAHLEDVSRQLKMEQQHLALQEQQVRSRESELSQAMQVEESRWSELISRLEQAVKK